MLEGNDELAEIADEDPVGHEELNLLEQLNQLDLNNDNDMNTSVVGISQENVGLSEATRGILNPSSPIFAEDRMSSKIASALKVIRENVVPTDDKAIIVSQWPTMLKLIGLQLKKEKIAFDQLDGSVPVIKRMAMVNDFNNPAHKTKVILMGFFQFYLLRCA